jgi:hypothetical protein
MSRAQAHVAAALGTSLQASMREALPSSLAFRTGCIFDRQMTVPVLAAKRLCVRSEDALLNPVTPTYALR